MTHTRVPGETVSKKSASGSSRRHFLQEAILLPAFSIIPARVLSGTGRTVPNDKTTLACIGMGGRGYQNLRTFLQFDELQIIAVCEVPSSSSAIAMSLLMKKTPPSRILEAAVEAHAGGAPMSPEVARKVVQLFRKFPGPSEPPDAHLTPQELRFLTLLSRGYSYQAAADELDVSLNTVRNYVRAIYEKLHVHSRSEAVGKALRSGLI
mgnify:CR=1 FL=1